MKGSRVKETIEAKREELERYKNQMLKLQRQIDGINEDIKILQNYCPHEWTKVIPEAVLKTCKFCDLTKY